MKIEKISDLTVKLTLNQNDFEKRSLNANTLRVDSPTYQRLLWDAVEHAEIELGEHIDTGRIRVEAASEETGRFEITITNMTEKRAQPEPEQKRESEQKREPEAQRSISPAPQQGRTVAVAAPASLLMQLVRAGVLPPALLQQGGTLRVQAIPMHPDAEGEKAETHVTPADLRHMMEHLVREEGALREPFADGNGVICFRSYDDLYAFFRGHRSLAALSSRLYMLEDTFYMVVHASERNLPLLQRLEVKLTDYDGICLPPAIFIPLLEEYATPVFKNGAIRKVIASLHP